MIYSLGSDYGKAGKSVSVDSNNNVFIGIGTYSAGTRLFGVAIDNGQGELTWSDTEYISEGIKGLHEITLSDGSFLFFCKCKDSNDDIYIAIYKSTESDGSNWSLQDTITGSGSENCYVCLLSSGDILVSVEKSGKIYKSTDDGASFSLLSRLTESNNANYLSEILEASDGNLYIATCPTDSSHGYNKFYKSTDGGANWTKLSDIGTSHYVIYNITVDNDDNFYVSIYKDLYKSTDSGNSWSKIYTFNKWIYSVLYYSDELYIILDYDANDSDEDVIFKSGDGGSNWSLEAGIDDFPGYETGGSGSAEIGCPARVGEKGIYIANDNSNTGKPFAYRYVGNIYISEINDTISIGGHADVYVPEQFDHSSNFTVINDELSITSLNESEIEVRLPTPFSINDTISINSSLFISESPLNINDKLILAGGMDIEVPSSFSINDELTLNGDINIENGRGSIINDKLILGGSINIFKEKSFYIFDNISIDGFMVGELSSGLVINDQIIISGSIDVETNTKSCDIMEFSENNRIRWC